MAKSTAAARRKKRPRASTAYSTLLSTADTVKTFFQTVCAPFDITGQQYNVLRNLRGAEPDGLPTLTIAERVIEQTPGITRMIGRLESKGLLSRQVGPHDRRCVDCRIPRNGVSLLRPLGEPGGQADHPT